jgi:uncharacterized membrane protein
VVHDIRQGDSYKNKKEELEAIGLVYYEHKVPRGVRGKDNVENDLNPSFLPSAFPSFPNPNFMPNTNLNPNPSSSFSSSSSASVNINDGNLV